MAHGASAACGDEQVVEQSVPLPAGGSVSSEREVSGDTEEKKAFVKRVKVAIESCSQSSFGSDSAGARLLHGLASCGLVDSLQQLIEVCGKNLLWQPTSTGKQLFTLLPSQDTRPPHGC